MISLFEQSPSQVAPVLVTEFVEQVGRGVHLLEFFALEASPPPTPGSEREDAPALTAESEAQDRMRQIRVLVDAAREETWASARAEAEQCELRLREEHRRQLKSVNAAVARDRIRYFAQAERQVVDLALAIARRVLARDAAADPLHLAAIVRVALSKVRDSSQSTLHVPTGTAVCWTELLGQAVDVVEDHELESDELVLKTDVGVVELGMRAQLAEIERTFAESISVGVAA